MNARPALTQTRKSAVGDRTMNWKPARQNRLTSDNSRHPNPKYMRQRNEISTLNGLIETLKDGQEGFRQASEAVKDCQLKMLFGEYSLQRAKFAGELQN